MKNTLRHVSNRRLKQIECDCRGILKNAEPTTMWDTHQSLRDVKKEQTVRDYR